MRGNSKTETINEFMKARGFADKFETLQVTGNVAAATQPKMTEQNTKFFLGMRESPRIAPKGEKRVTVKRESGEELDLKLLDLSRGGAGVELDHPEVLKKGEWIEFVAFDGGARLKKALRGQIMAIRDGEELGTFKAGIKFVAESGEEEAA